MRRPIACVVPFLLVVAGCDSPSVPAPSPPLTSTAPTVPNPPPPPADDDPLTGTYGLELTINELGAGCQNVPEAVRRRTYTATIRATTNGNYVVSLTGAAFLQGAICTFAPARLECNQFPASRTGDVFAFNLINENDEGHGGHIVEHVLQAVWIEVIGTATGALDNGRITAKGNGSLWYCPSSSGYPFPCGAAAGCEFNDLRMTFTPQ